MRRGDGTQKRTLYLSGTAARDAEPAAAGIFPRGGGQRRLRRGARRRQELGHAAQARAARDALPGAEAPAAAPDAAGAARQPHPAAAAGARGLRRMERRGARVPVPERVAARDGLLRQRQRLRPVSGAGVRGDRLRGGDELRARLADVHRDLPAHDAHGFRTAHLLHLQPRRAGPRLHQAPVHRPRVSRRRGPGGLCVHPGEGLRQPGAHAARPRLSQAAGGAAARTAARAP